MIPYVLIKWVALSITICVGTAWHFWKSEREENRKHAAELRRLEESDR